MAPAGRSGCRSGLVARTLAQEHLRTYAHVIIDRSELDHAELLERDCVVHTPVHTPFVK